MSIPQFNQPMYSQIALPYNQGLAAEMAQSAVRQEIVSKDWPAIHQQFMYQLKQAIDKGETEKIVYTAIRISTLDELGRAIVQRGQTRPNNERR